jgi:mannose-1-phosphate guanylyltransferase
MSEIESDLGFIRVNREAFETWPDETVDYSVMVQTYNAVFVPMAVA